MQDKPFDERGAISKNGKAIAARLERLFVNLGDDGSFPIEYLDREKILDELRVLQRILEKLGS